jgi:Ca2+-binding RTX toxin-like protein
MTGGEGRDRAYMFAAGPLAVTLGPGGMDVESVTVERADATVRGNTSVNEIITGEGKDDVDPGAGFDTVDTGKGDDRVNVRDGFPDLVSCGEGADAVVADTQDEVESNCEAVDRAAIAPPATPGAPVAAGLIAPTDLQISARRSGRNTILRGRLMLPAGASAALCDGGGITLKVGKRRIGTTLNAKCAFTVKLKGRVKRSKVKAYFAGTPALAPVTR